MPSEADPQNADDASHAKRLAFIEWLAAGGLPDLADDTVVGRAWAREAPPATPANPRHRPPILQSPSPSAR